MHMHALAFRYRVCARDFCLTSWDAVCLDWEGGFVSGPAINCVKAVLKVF